MSRGRLGWRGLCIAALLAGCATSSAVRKAERDGDLLALDLAREYVKKGAYDAAVPLLQRSVAKHPKSAEVRLLYGTVLRARRLYPQAEQELRTAIDLDPKQASAYAGLGILLDLTRRHDEAQVAHRKAIDLAPRSGRFWNNLGFSLYVTGRDAEAIEALERALQLDPSLAIAYNNLGFAYGRTGDYDNAIRCFRTAGGDRAAQLNMALVHERAGNVQLAEKLRKEAQP